MKYLPHRLTRKPRVSLANLARLLWYGSQWVKEEPPQDPDPKMQAYWTGGLETVAHLGACVLTQDHTGDSTDTGEIRDLLADFPSEKLLEKRLTRFVREVRAAKV